MSQTDIAITRIYDPGRGAFCAMDKQGNPTGMPPVRRDPVPNFKTNPRGVRHINKTAQDRMPRDSRPRVQDADRRRSKMQKVA